MMMGLIKLFIEKKKKKKKKKTENQKKKRELFLGKELF